MAIKTADQLEPGKLHDYTGGNTKLERKILGLSAQTILISEGVIELLRDEKEGKYVI